ncbi:MAG: 1-acyl-sn-glycerol-3-phosphate acyltransferase [Bacteroidetes bacterium]|nr:1-acyl-sn-glycerol-3-phosphate acyltransferase [Bacteroidota bacterium]
MKILLKLFQLLYCLYAYFIFIVCMLLVFPFAVVASFWGKMAGGNLIYKICHVWTDVWFFCSGIRHRNIFEASVEKDKQYIFIANHISYLDIPVIFTTIRGRAIRILGKAEMKKIPIFGFIYSRGAVMVDRSDADKRAKSVRNLKSILKKGVSIFIYPEGTFNETHQPLKDFYDGAFRIAIETKTPIRPILFLDTYDRMNYKSIFSLTPGRSRSVFLDEVSAEEYSLSEVALLKNKVYAQMEKKLLEYRASWIKEG